MILSLQQCTDMLKSRLWIKRAYSSSIVVTGHVMYELFMNVVPLLCEMKADHVIKKFPLSLYFYRPSFHIYNVRETSIAFGMLTHSLARIYSELS